MGPVAEVGAGTGARPVAEVAAGPVALEVEEVSDPSDPRISLYRDLKDSALRRRLEPEEGVFVVEGKLALQALLASAYPLVSVLVLRRRLGVLAGLGLPPGTRALVAADDVMESVTGFDVHRGVLALGRRLPARNASELLASPPPGPPPGATPSPLVVAEALSDQENLGAIFRNAAAFGARAVLLGPTCGDPLYRRSVRVSQGAVLQVPYATLAPWPNALESLKDKGFFPLALTPSPRAEPVARVAYELQGHDVALVVGAEGPGLSPDVLSRCRQVRVPMAPGVDSLNVAAATAVALYEFSGLARR
ncbi:MAG TPA: RNA methyltransferase [Acidimicrobiales bacterium]|nr:RNA methyltransferase [Acidimicrobiales bacterium]